MRKLFLVAASVCITLFALAQPPKGPATAGMTFGKKIDAKNAIGVNDLSDKVDGEETAVKVKGKVTDVCKMEGCWLKLESGVGKIMVKMKDHVFLVPVDINGKEVVVDGTAKMKVTSVEELQHYAKDAGKSKEEIAAIKEPQKEIVLNAQGILVL